MGSDGDAVVVPLRRRPTPAAVPAEMLTIKDVAKACGLPQPVIAQLVPHTETAAGHMYTAEQQHYAIELAEQIRARNRRHSSTEQPPGFTDRSGGTTRP